MLLLTLPIRLAFKIVSGVAKLVLRVVRILIP